MAVQLTQHSAAEVAARGKEIYERDIRPQVEADNFGKVVAIDVISGDYELGEDVLVSVPQLRARKPEAEIWLMRVGFPALHKMPSIFHSR